jgi:uncharacterized repeat protein (TIGR01451 family)
MSSDVMRRPAERRSLGPPLLLGALIALLAMLAGLALPASGLGVNLTVYAGGDRNPDGAGTNNTELGYSQPLIDVTFEARRANLDGSLAPGLDPNVYTCTTAGATGTCDISVPNPGTGIIHYYRVQPAAAPSGFSVVSKVSIGGPSNQAGRLVDYFGNRNPASTNSANVPGITGNELNPSIVRVVGDTSPRLVYPTRFGINAAGTSVVETEFHQRFALRRDNPDLPRACGTHFRLVLDVSGSINPGGDPEVNNFRPQFRAAARAFAAALEGQPGARVTLATFGNANTNIGSYQMDDAGEYSALLVAINTAYGFDGTDYNDWPQQGTNWDDALWASREASAGDAVIFLTDGNPTLRRSGPSTGGRVDSTDVAYAIASANTAKSAGKRIVPIGAGDAVTQANLAAISGNSDFFVGDIDELTKLLEEVANEFCGARVHVKKYLDGEATNDWDFKAETEAGELLSSELTTATTSALGAGTGTFRINNVPTEGTDEVDITELLPDPNPDNVSFKAATCVKKDGEEPISASDFPSVDDALTAEGPNPQTISNVEQQEDWFCTFVNIGTGNLTVVKSMDPEDGATFKLKAVGEGKTIETEDPEYGGDGHTTGKQEVPTGTFTISEIAKPDDPSAKLKYFDTKIECTEAGDPIEPINDGPSVQVAKDADVTCVITNERKTTDVTVKKVIFTDEADTTTEFEILVNGAATTFVQGTSQKFTAPLGLEFTVAEPNPTTGYELRDISCSKVQIDPSTQEQTPLTRAFTPKSEKPWECTVYNDRLPEIVVNKVVTGAPGDPTKFDFSLTPGEIDVANDVAPSIFQLADGESTRPANPQFVPAFTPSTLSEKLPVPAGYAFDKVACDLVGGIVPVEVNGKAFTIDGPKVEIGGLPYGAVVTCTYTNLKRPTVTVRKVVTNASGTQPAFNAVLNGNGGPLAFNGLVANGPASPAQLLNAGTQYTLTEPSVPAGYTLTSIVCNGGGASFTPAPGQNVACVITNNQTPSPPPDVVPDVTPTPTPPVVRPARVAPTRLAITKTAPRRARVGARFVYTVRVRNAGNAVARNVVLTDPLPRGLVLVRSAPRARVSGRTITVRLGNMRPGQVRVVRFTVRSTPSVRGQRVNVATARADNARAVRARAVTRFAVPAPRPVRPAVTG